ncbi:isoprenylcysteine carboxylmethyltransferase family protein [Desulfurococcaceae archaeon MEX13E-LK6-19]|nr:isoprenylcysteine carboxylmethyltransferase family protein [Desulfurococcaceae archaeon MEX13E-LK6-19]
MGVIDKLLTWAKRERDRRHLVAFLVIGAIVFVFLFPLAIVCVSLFLDRMQGINLGFEPYNIVIALILIPVGLFFIAWAAWAQWSIGRGTPVPAAPPRRLVVEGPYAYCRNPMLLGTMLYYLGLVFLVNSVTGIAIVLLVQAIFIAYVKLIEERELELRFGSEYIEYKRRTPFLIPRPRKR